MTTTNGASTARASRKSLADQIDRLAGILDGLDAALSGAVQDAVEQGVRQAVQSVMTEFLTNEHLHEQLRRAAQPSRGGEQANGKGGMLQRMWSAACETAGRAARLAREAGRRGGALLIAAGGFLAAGLYIARTHIASAASFVYGLAKAAVVAVGAALFRLLPAFGFCGI
jgi:hypothetical protein